MPEDQAQNKELNEELKTPDELFDEAEEEIDRRVAAEQELVEQGMQILERTVIDARVRTYTVYLYTLEDPEPYVVSSSLDGVKQVLQLLEQWLPARIKFAVRKRVIGVNGYREEILETRIRRILEVKPLTDFKLPWQKVTVRRKHRIFIRLGNEVIFFDETENSDALEDYMKAKGEIEMEVIMVTAGNIRIGETERIQGIYWLTREMWRSLKQRLQQQQQQGQSHEEAGAEAEQASEASKVEEREAKEALEESAEDGLTV